MAKTVFLRGKEEIDAIREAARLVARTLTMLGREVRPGVSTARLDELAEAFIRDHGARPAFKGYRGFPASICPSINDEVVHGIPGPRTLAEGDIVGMDVGVEKDGYFGDAACTFPVGKVGDDVERLLQVTREALMRGVAQAKAGNRVGDISHAIQSHVEAHGFSVVRSLVGHGIGRSFHSNLFVPHVDTPDATTEMVPGMTFTIEPMITLGTNQYDTWPDGWTVVTKDGSLSAHFEHTVAVGVEGPEVLSLSDGD